MRLIPILTAATIGLFATAAIAQNMNTTDPNSAPGASQAGKGKVMAPTKGQVQKMDTTDPNSAPGASQAGKGRVSGQANDQAAKANTADPNSAPGASTNGAGMKKAKHARHHSKKMKKEM
jgi:hypothetical protein